MLIFPRVRNILELFGRFSSVARMIDQEPGVSPSAKAAVRDFSIRDRNERNPLSAAPSRNGTITGHIDIIPTIPTVAISHMMSIFSSSDLLSNQSVIPVSRSFCSFGMLPVLTSGKSPRFCFKLRSKSQIMDFCSSAFMPQKGFSNFMLSSCVCARRNSCLLSSGMFFVSCNAM